jgi:hypothetical protein
VRMRWHQGFIFAYRVQQRYGKKGGRGK